MFDSLLKILKKNFTFYIEVNLVMFYVELYKEIFESRKLRDRDQLLQYLRNIKMTWLNVVDKEILDRIRYNLIKINIEDVNFGF